MKKLISAALGLAALGLAAPASAADLAARPYTKAPPPMVAAIYDWSGFYIGINGGGAWSHKCWDTGPFTFGVIAVFTSPGGREGCHDASGGVVGGQAGYRWQAGAWVFGLEAQGDWADLTASNTSLIFVPGGRFVTGVTNNTKIDAIGVFTGQIGYAWNNVLFYVKGGGMVVNDKFQGTATGIGTVLDNVSDTRWGGAVGAGLDFGITPNVVLGIDYVHGFMGNRNLTFVSTTGAFSRTETIRQDIDMVTARLSYKFGGPVIAKY
ncbi:outer membrane beta-barrel protein [Bradyrhizobium sp. KBS0727]|uniref:outer membrane protein n=1 Tax=unclassified Bradyrhizobium TaxID=2631580 RepID=UPI00110E4507|nr:MULTISPECIES: outer membrane beta-barrel protein [unclassified Bradyrhizobium]QDW38681.1 outer membrane beta-barrel protein [Bradyrhizobium sp. KBS0725]QDW45285.1 outer membrane beta-barrel protein [Bradyrhizobium sp. KBS0727]